MTATPTPLTLPTPEHAEPWLDERVSTELDRARTLVADLKTPLGETTRTAAEVLAIWNDVEIALSNVSSIASLFGEVHPIPAVRERAEAAAQEAERLATELGLDPDLYAVFSAFETTGRESLDPQAARVLDHALRDFRRAGVDRDPATRERIRELNERAVKVGQDYSRGIRDDVRSIRVRPDQLDGLPDDWLALHPAGEDGLITVTTDYPDAIPVRTFCRDPQVRRDLLVASLNVGWPDNDPRIKEVFAIRAELAQLLGYDDWADYDAEVKMIGSGAAIPEFIDEIADASADAAHRDYAVLLERMRVDHPDAEAIDAADLMFYAEAVRREQHDVDARQVRRYFDITRVRAGLLEVTGRLFGLRYEPAQDAVLWDEEVRAYDVYRVTRPVAGLEPDGGEGPERLIGRIYLDLHPREGKYKHAAQFDLVNGVAGRQLPEGVLVCNFSRAVMEHDEVVTLFHEFGHLLHHVLGGHVDWVGFSGVATEWDFVEAPSQMLEEWAWDPEVLRTFAVDPTAGSGGEPIPADLVRRMRRADDFGKGYVARTQMFYAAMSYYFHIEQPPDLTARTRELQARYSMFPYIEGTHMPASFGHLEGYGSGYYTYMWSMVIAKDMFSAFDPANLFEPGVAFRYRDAVLAPGGSKDAADLVADFLGRPYSVESFRRWLAE